jgi:hypothetical protein
MNSGSKPVVSLRARSVSALPAGSTSVRAPSIDGGRIVSSPYWFEADRLPLHCADQSALGITPLHCCCFKRTLRGGGARWHWIPAQSAGSNPNWLAATIITTTGGKRSLHPIPCTCAPGVWWSWPRRHHELVSCQLRIQKRLACSCRPTDEAARAT